jgi:hypothetical protein
MESREVRWERSRLQVIGWQEVLFYFLALAEAAESV